MFKPDHRDPLLKEFLKNEQSRVRKSLNFAKVYELADAVNSAVWEHKIFNDTMHPYYALTAADTGKISV